MCKNFAFWTSRVKGLMAGDAGHVVQAHMQQEYLHDTMILVPDNSGMGQWVDGPKALSSWQSLCVTGTEDANEVPAVSCMMKDQGLAVVVVVLVLALLWYGQKLELHGQFEKTK